MNPICKIWGHKFADSVTNQGPWNCARCDHVCDPYSEEEYDSKSLNLGGRWYILKQYAIRYIQHKFRWFLKCSDCGKRFNKHTNDCTPF